MVTRYQPEVLDPESDDGTMVNSRVALENAVVGHRIVNVEMNVQIQDSYGDWETGTVITLSNGQSVQMVGVGDCCAFTELKAFLLHPDRVDHVIMGVGTTDGYQTWHVFADAGDILELTVDWSCGNPFYYGYGFNISVEGPDLYLIDEVPEL